jgi:hypothetical protein
VFIAGLNAGLRPHWAVRVSWGLLVHGIATERGLYLASGGIVSIF